MGRTVRVFGAALGGVLAATLAGCAAPPRSSVMTIEDYQNIACEIAPKLAEGLARLRAASGGATIALTVQKVVNLTDDQIADPAKWYLIQRVREDPAVKRAARDNDVAILIPAERLEQARSVGAIEPGLAVDGRPTHVLTATFLSARRASGKDRTDAYQCNYEILALEGEVVWTGIAEFKRVARGRVYD